MDFLLHLNWVAVGQIILIDLLLGGDNAIVIALACRNLPAKLRMKGILWGTAGAILIRIVLIAFAVTLLQVPFLKLAGGLLLLWIGIKLLSDQGDSHADLHGSDRLLSAIRTIIIADLVMSIDNVIAVASAAEQSAGEHQLMLVTFGILVSVPIVVWGSTLVLKLMELLPIIITLGAALLGYLAGEMITSDIALAGWFEATLPPQALRFDLFGLTPSVPGIVGAFGVVLAGKWLVRRTSAPAAPH
ncbi:Membrane protein TerC, possibly involved in tellurium resistance [Oxalobacteraceae bacterium IMCC9480]|nr:Membrane protein TerC, possibly involved in tellurium resistance [Oxalobacteraceae bacterium IMCC9480]NDP60505.1 TerC family protein [Oxalobacteraceae bacterium]